MQRIRILIEKCVALRPVCHNGTNDGVNAGPVSFVACIEPPHSGRSYPSPVQTLVGMAGLRSVWLYGSAQRVRKIKVIPSITLVSVNPLDS